jgi:DNA-binding MarR family transcriptional regulator
MERDRGGAAGTAPVASLMEISRVLEETARLVREHVERGGEPAPGGRGEGAAVGARQVRAILALRGLRRDYLGRDFSEAAWAMILEVYAARLEGRSIHQSLVGFETGVPPTTALATVRRLLDRGVFLKQTDPSDKRMVLLTLADEWAESLARFLSAAAQIAPILV